MKPLILALLEHQVKKFLKKHQPKLVVFTGSVGKTSTKLFTATVLSQKLRVMAHFGNHNTHFSVPLALTNVSYPKNIRNPFAWLRVLTAMRRAVRSPFSYDVILLELGTDHPGEIPHFGKYLQPDIAVVTGVAEEHMEFFKTLDAVAKEELSVASFSKLTLINRDDIDVSFAKYAETTSIDTYGNGAAEYHYLTQKYQPATGFEGAFVSPEWGEVPAKLHLVGEHNVTSAVAAATVAVKLGLSKEQVAKGLEAIRPVAGRMQLLRGLRDSWLIDDTYNSSPKSALAALQTLYLFPVAQKIAILGSMNELGEVSEAAHKRVGEACDPAQLDWVVTVGEQAQKFLAPAAARRGCQVKSFMSPYDAGVFVHSVMHPKAVVLAKGSQNRIFTEEALKMLLHATAEESQLVRQEPEWLAIKQQQFAKFADEPAGKRVAPK